MIGRPRRCPACLSTQFRRSRRTRLRFVLKLLCVQPFRCASCGRRAWRFNPLGTELGDGGPPELARVG